MFLLKTVLWLSLGILLIPSGKEASTSGQGEISGFEVLSAAKAVWNDCATFCERNQEACETSHRLVSRFGDKAGNGARMLYEYLNENLDETGADDDVSGSVAR
jgi:hypothetical protein